MRRNYRHILTGCFVFILLCSFQQSVFPADSSKDSGCGPVFDATDKTLSVPHHVYDATPGQPNEESIAIDGVSYILANGKWKKGPMTVKERLEQVQKNRKNAKSYSCTYVRDEPVGSEAAAVYKVRAVINEGYTIDGQMWISKSRGLILREEEDDNSDKKTHHSTRYEYDNVKAPWVPAEP